MPGEYRLGRRRSRRVRNKRLILENEDYDDGSDSCSDVSSSSLYLSSSSYSYDSEYSSSLSDSDASSTITPPRISKSLSKRSKSRRKQDRSKANAMYQQQPYPRLFYQPPLYYPNPYYNPYAPPPIPSNIQTALAPQPLENPPTPVTKPAAQTPKKSKSKKPSSNSSRKLNSVEVKQTQPSGTFSGIKDLFNRGLNSLKQLPSFALSSSSDVVQFDRFSLDATLDHLRLSHGTRLLHVFSLNVLADEYTKNPRVKSLYKHCHPKALEWSSRAAHLCKILNSCTSDLVCLQEVGRSAFDLTLNPLMKSKNHTGVLHCSTISLKNEQKGKGKSTKEVPGLATFFNDDRFELVKVVKSFRALIIQLKFKSSELNSSFTFGKTIVVVNLHLDGNPTRTTQRRDQLRAALRKSQKLNPDYLIFGGDFNSNWRGISQQLLQNNKYKLNRTYTDPDIDKSCLLVPDKSPDSSKSEAMIDHIVHDSRGLRPVGIQRVFDSTWDRKAMLTEGLPSLLWPSDHLSIGAIFRLKDVTLLDDEMVSQEVSRKEEHNKETLSGGLKQLTRELHTLLGDELWTEFERLLQEERKLKEELRKSGRKVDANEIEKAKVRSQRKKQLMEGMQQEARIKLKEYLKKLKIQEKGSSRKTKK